MIPKKIHYCWFGRGELNKKARKCISSWKKHCHDYELIEWNEDNYDVNQNAYTAYLYAEKKFAFLSDYVRLQKIYEEGGIYFDVDVEVIKSLDSSQLFFSLKLISMLLQGLALERKKEIRLFLPCLRNTTGFLMANMAQ